MASPLKEKKPPPKGNKLGEEEPTGKAGKPANEPQKPTGSEHPEASISEPARME